MVTVHVFVYICMCVYVFMGILFLADGDCSDCRIGIGDTVLIQY